MATERRGQAFVELACGMFALALVLSAVFSFIRGVAASLDRHRTLRARAGCAALVSNGGYASASAEASVTVEPLAADYLFGRREIRLREEVHMPATGGLR
jgi:hypothetical protein